MGKFQLESRGNLIGGKVSIKRLKYNHLPAEIGVEKPYIFCGFYVVSTLFPKIMAHTYCGVFIYKM